MYINPYTSFHQTPLCAMALILPPPDVLSFNVASDPWKGDPVLESYSLTDAKSVSDAVAHLCKLQEQTWALVPIIKYAAAANGLYFYVALERVGGLLNIVQYRFDFDGTGYTVLQRQVYVSKDIIAKFPYMKFASVRLSDEEAGKLYWKSLNCETEIKIRELLNERPQFVLLPPGSDVYVVMHPRSLANPNFLTHRVRYSPDQIVTLSAALLECVQRPNEEFDMMVPGFDVDCWFSVVSRDAGSTTINVTYINDALKQFRVDVSHRDAALIVPGFDITSVRLTPAERSELIHRNVLGHWKRQIGSIVPISDSLDFFATFHDYAFSQSPNSGGQHFAPFTKASSITVHCAVASMVYGGMTTNAIVPVNAVMLQSLPSLKFVVVFCTKPLCFKFAFVFFNSNGLVNVRDVGIPDSLKLAKQHMTFESCQPQDHDRVKSILFGTLHQELHRVYETLTIVQGGGDVVGFEIQVQYLKPLSNGSFFSTRYHVEDEERVAKALKCMITDPSIRLLMIPLKHGSTFAFACAVRQGLHTLSITHVVKSDLVYGVIVHTTDTSGTKLISSDTIDSDVFNLCFEKPIFDSTSSVAYSNLHIPSMRILFKGVPFMTVSPRVIAICMALHKRLGNLSSMHCLSSDLMKLCLKDGTVPRK